MNKYTQYFPVGGSQPAGNQTRQAFEHPVAGFRVQQA
jgi:hypothetical protein